MLPTYRIEREKTDAGWLFVAWFPSIPGLRAQAESEDAAVRSLYEILPRYVDAMKRHGVTVIEPRTVLEAKTEGSMAMQGSTSTWSLTVRLQPA